MACVASGVVVVLRTLSRSVGLVSCLLVVVGGCDPKYDDCKAAIETINTTVDKINKSAVGSKDARESAKQYKEFSATIRAEGDKIAAMSIRTETLKGYVEAYAEMAKEAAAAAEAMASVLEELAALEEEAEKAPSQERVQKAQELQKKIDDAKEALDKVIEKEDPLVDKINTFCDAK
jgi:methyl-accepting chemotaxis protein